MAEIPAEAYAAAANAILEGSEKFTDDELGVIRGRVGQRNLRLRAVVDAVWPIAVAEGLQQGTDLRLQELTRAALDLVSDIRDHLAGPIAPDHEIRTWPLWASSDDGGIYCGDDDCPLQAESSEIGDFHDRRHRGDRVFTLDELHTAIGEHIALRRDKEGDE